MVQVRSGVYWLQPLNPNRKFQRRTLLFFFLSFFYFSLDFSPKKWADLPKIWKLDSRLVHTTLLHVKVQCNWFFFWKLLKFFKINVRILNTAKVKTVILFSYTSMKLSKRMYFFRKKFFAIQLDRKKAFHLKDTNPKHFTKNFLLKKKKNVLV